jgi:hypothetical protein
MANSVSNVQRRVLNAKNSNAAEDKGTMAFEPLNKLYRTQLAHIEGINRAFVLMLDSNEIKDKIGSLSDKENSELAKVINAYSREHNLLLQKIGDTYGLHKDRAGRVKSAEDVQLLHSCSNTYLESMGFYESVVIPLTEQITDLIFKDDGKSDASNVNVVTDVVAKDI